MKKTLEIFLICCQIILNDYKKDILLYRSEEKKHNKRIQSVLYDLVGAVEFPLYFLASRLKIIIFPTYIIILSLYQMVID